LKQVEYAMEAINHAGAAVGILSSEGVVLGAERKLTSGLLERTVQSEKMYQLDSHIVVAAAGLTSDSNTLISHARLMSQQYSYTYQEPMPVEQLVRQLCDSKQKYTQHGGLRPFGTAFLYAGWDSIYGLQLYSSDPSGNYMGWKATAIGANSPSASGILRQDYDENCTLKQALSLAAKVVSKSMDTTSPDPEKLELVTLTREQGKVCFRTLSDAEVQAIIQENEVPS
jgi:20S proteasome subunit alpha 3